MTPPNTATRYLTEVAVAVMRELEGARAKMGVALTVGNSKWAIGVFCAKRVMWQKG